MESIPSTNVIPAKIGSESDRIVHFLDERDLDLLIFKVIVDGFNFLLLTLFRGQGEDFFDARHYLGAGFFKPSNHIGGIIKVATAIPEVLPAFDVFDGSFEVGFFFELGNLIDLILAIMEELAGFHIAKASIGLVGLDSESEELLGVILDIGEGMGVGIDIFGGFVDDMVAGGGGDNSLRVFLIEKRSNIAHSGRGVSTARLEEKMIFFDFGEMLKDNAFVSGDGGDINLLDGEDLS